MSKERALDLVFFLLHTFAPPESDALAGRAAEIEILAINKTVFLLLSISPLS